MEANNKVMRKALTDLVNYLNKEVKRTSKCNRCQYKGKTFRGEPCYWHVDCGIDECDDKASDNAMYLLKRFKLQEALATPPRNCDRFASAEEAWDAYDEWVESYRAKGEVPPFNEFGWLFATATEKEGGAK